MHLNRTVLGELDGVGEQVFQYLAQAPRVGLQARRYVGIDGAGERQSLLPGQWTQRVEQGGQRFGGGDGFDVHVGLARFDLGEVENVVDQYEQVVAGGIDRLRVFHLLGAQVAGLVVAQQLGQNERGIERGTQFVAHVGQKLALVLAGQFKFPGLGGQNLLGHKQLFALLFQLAGLLFQLRVGLLQFGLVQLHLGLRSLERAALLLQLFVGYAQLFLLRLQLL